MVWFFIFMQAVPTPPEMTRKNMAARNPILPVACGEANKVVAFKDLFQSLQPSAGMTVPVDIAGKTKDAGPSAPAAQVSLVVSGNVR
jgi:hypothetical protein